MTKKTRNTVQYYLFPIWLCYCIMFCTLLCLYFHNQDPIHSDKIEGFIVVMTPICVFAGMLILNKKIEDENINDHHHGVSDIPRIPDKVEFEVLKKYKEELRAVRESQKK